MNTARRAGLALAVTALVGTGLAACSDSHPPLPSTSCTTTTPKGSCGPYRSYSRITGSTAIWSPSVGQDVLRPSFPGLRQTLHVANPGNWYVTARMPAGNRSVLSYPSIGIGYGQHTDAPTPLSDYTSIHSSFAEDMHRVSGTSAEAAYDVWLGQGTNSNGHNEVMIQHDIVNRGTCNYTVTNVAFGGSHGVPVKKWNLCIYHAELIWQMVGQGEQSGTVDILSMLTWLERHGYLPAKSGLDGIGYGFEICSTGGKDENFQVTRFTLAPTFAASQLQYPAAVTNAATAVGSSRAILNGFVVPGGANATYRFDYGTGTHYGSSVLARSAGSGTSAVSESYVLTGLQPGTTYHYRLEATNRLGTSYGRDQTFITRAASPSPSNNGD